MIISDTIQSLAMDLIRIPSVSSDIPRLQEIIDFVVAYFDHLDVHISRYVDADKPSVVIQNFEGKHADIILNGHLDVVPSSQDDQFDPLVNNGKLYARGATDMKVGCALLMHLFAQLVKEGCTKKIILMLTTDEEVGGENGVGYLVQQGYTANVVLIPDAGDTDTIVYAQKGICQFDLLATGQACHSSMPWLGDNAIHRLLLCIQDLRKQLEDTRALYERDDHWMTSVNCNALIAGGEAYNAVPDQATAKIDIRFTEQYTFDSLWHNIQDIVHRHHCKAILHSRGGLAYTDVHHPYIQRYCRIVEEVLHRPLQTKKEHGGSDGRFFAEHGAVVILHEPTGGNFHANDEWVTLKDIPYVYECFYRFVKEVVL